MLTRLEIDNFRCFEGFVWEPGRKQLILGANGCGKSSMMDALTKLRRFVSGDEKVEVLFPLGQRTRWSKDPEQEFSLLAEIDGVRYSYNLQVKISGNPQKAVVGSETLDCGDGALVIRFSRGSVKVKTGSHAPILYSLDRGRSAISSLGDTKANELAHRFRRWLNELYCFRLNPFKMTSRADGEDAFPAVNLSNFAAWYRNLYLQSPKWAVNLFESLGETLDGFDALQFEDAGDGMRLLNVEFKQEGTKKVKFRFRELSEGQRCLICLYTILHFVLAGGRTVLIDEPENFIGLREIQPWLMEASAMVSDSEAQLILISHNPALIDQWAPGYGVRFLRVGASAVRVEPWRGDPESGLTSSELIARGWDDA